MKSAIEIEQLVDMETGSLSPAVFTDPDIYQQELKQIFAKSWLFLGHESQIPKFGDFFTSYMAEDQVVVARQKDGSVVAFLNQCRHRGMRICRSEVGNAKAFTCAYHGWAYDVGGGLKAIPHEDQYGKDFDKANWGARRVTRLESYKGLLFANWDAGAPGLVESLDAATYYLDGLVDRMEGGSEVVAGVHKWVIDCNWKMPAEQFVSDMYHAATSHVSAIQACLPEDYDPAVHSMDQRDGYQFWTDEGHGGGYFKADAPNPSVWLDPLVKSWLTSTFDAVRERLGAHNAARVSGHNTLFPNFSWLNGTNTLRVWHPRGPNQIEVWSWVLVDKAAPDDVKNAFRRSALRAFGPSGMLEQDDGENWVEVQKVMRGRAAQESRLCYQMALGKPELQLEGVSGHHGPLFSDMAARNFYRRWAELMVRPPANSAPVTFHPAGKCGGSHV
jgi:3-phenylpropionate/trans-cinnamate dioxygenase alpha subunit